MNVVLVILIVAVVCGLYGASLEKIASPGALTNFAGKTALEEIKFQAGISNVAYYTETNPGVISTFAKENGLAFDPATDSFSDVSTNTSFVCLQKSLGGGKWAVYLGFRGTLISSMENIKEDLDMSLVDFYGTKVSNGFLKSWMGLRQGVVALLARYRPTQLYITGHSLGASIAAIAAVDLRKSSIQEPVLYTFASPRTGDAGFVDLFKSTVGKSYRVEGLYDPVPRFPTLLQGYAHIPTRILLQDGKCTVGGPAPDNHPWDIKYHFLSVYMALLDSLPMNSCA